MTRATQVSCTILLHDIILSVSFTSVDHQFQNHPQNNMSKFHDFFLTNNAIGISRSKHEWYNGNFRYGGVLATKVLRLMYNISMPSWHNLQILYIYGDKIRHDCLLKIGFKSLTESCTFLKKKNFNRWNPPLNCRSEVRRFSVVSLLKKKTLSYKFIREPEMKLSEQNISWFKLFILPWGWYWNQTICVCYKSSNFHIFKPWVFMNSKS